MRIFQRTKKYIDRVSAGLELARNVSNDSKIELYLVVKDMAACWLNKKINPSDYCSYGLIGKTNAEKDEYLSKREMDALQKRINTNYGAKIADDKILFFQHCIANLISTPMVYGYISSITDSSVDDELLVKDVNALSSVIDSLEDNHLLIKPLDGGCGVGVMVLRKCGRSLYDLNDNLWDAQKLFDHCTSSGINSYGNQSKGFLLQEFLTNHSDLAGIMPGPGLGTIRIHTVLGSDGQVDVFHVLMRCPRKGNIVDNIRHGETGNMFAQVDIKTGRVELAYSVDYVKRTCIKVDTHPDTGQRFDSCTIPLWDKVLQFVCEGAIRCDFLKTIGWDIAVTDKGIYVVEINWHYDPFAQQVLLGRGIKSDILHFFSKAEGFNS
jgi:hypothetical protein